MITPVQHHEAIAGVVAYLRLFLYCTNYHSIVLLNDNLSTDLSTSILHEVQKLKQVFWLSTNMETVNHGLFTGESSALYQNPNSLILNLIHGPQIAKQFKAFRKALAVNEKCDNLIVTIGDIDEVQIEHVLQVIYDYRILNIGILYEPEVNMAALITLHYNSFVSQKVNIINQSCVDLKSEIFYDKTQDLRNQEIVIYMFFEVPRVINVSQPVDDIDLYPYDVGGRDAYFSTLIDYRFGTISTNVARKYSPQFVLENYELSKFFLEFMQKPYREDGLEPGKLDYILLDDEAYNE